MGDDFAISRRFQVQSVRTHRAKSRPEAYFANKYIYFAQILSHFKGFSGRWDLESPPDRPASLVAAAVLW